MMSRSSPRLELIVASDRSVMLSLGEALDEEVQRAVTGLFWQLSGRQDLGLISVQPAYSSVLITFDLAQTNHRKIRAVLEQIEPFAESYFTTAGRAIEIPVCYHAKFAPDLSNVAHHAGLPEEEVIRLHSSAAYRVAFLGFMPGFPYLSGLPPALRTPRLQRPRLKVAAGSVGIAGGQTGIYPFEVPGGWQIIGRTPLALFDPGRQRLCLLETGDEVAFRRISPEEFRILEAKCEG